MHQAGIDRTSHEPPGRRRAIVGAAAAAFITFGTHVAEIATAQENANPIPQGRFEAPIGHRQPRASDLPPKVLNGEGRETAGEKEMDRKLNSICRGC
jgi:hypothetical protein